MVHRHATVVMAPIAAVAAICLVLLALSWPILVARPRQLPVAITGQSQAVAHAKAAITSSSRDAIDLEHVGDRAAAVSAITERNAIGAVVLDPAHPEVLIASAGGSAEQQVMSQLASGLQQQLHQQSHQQDPGAAATPSLTVTDVVPLSADDPTGSRLAIAGLPLALGGVVGGALLSSVLTGVKRQLVGLVAYAVLAGLGLTAILGPWFGAFHGTYALGAAAITMIVLAVAAVVIGLGRLLGRAGFAVAALLFILGATPLSGATVPRDFLPHPLAVLGGWFPQGAGNTLLRNLSYFPDASTTSGWLVPAIWTGIGVALIALSLRRTAARTAADSTGSAPRPSATAAVN